MTPFPDRPRLQVSRVERTSRHPWRRGDRGGPRLPPFCRSRGRSYIPPPPPADSARQRRLSAEVWGLAGLRRREIRQLRRAGSEAHFLSQALSDTSSTFLLYPDQIIVKRGIGSPSGGLQPKFYAIQKSESARALGYEVRRSQRRGAALAICALAWALRLLLNVIWRLVCPRPRQVCREVCAHTQNARGRLPGPPTWVSRSAGLAGAAGRCILSGDPLGPRRGRSLPLNNILPSPSAAVLGGGVPSITSFAVARDPWSQGFHSATVPGTTFRKSEGSGRRGLSL